MSDWIEAFYQVPSPAHDRHVGQMMDAVIREYNQRPDELDASLASIDLVRLEEILLLAIIRTLYPARKSLSNWPPLRDRMRSEFIRRGLDHEELLQGL